MHLKTLNCFKLLAPLALTVISVAAATAQNMNDWRVGGSLFLDLSSSSSKDNGTTTPGEKTSTFNFSPFAGYDFTKNWEAGLSIGVSTQTSKIPGDESSEKNSSNFFNVGPYARYYWHCEKIPWVSPVAEGYIGVGFGANKNSTTVSGNTTTNTTNQFSFTTSVSPGLSFDICKSVSIEAFFGGLSFTNTTSKPKEDPSFKSNTSSFGLSWSNGFGFGLSFKL